MIQPHRYIGTVEVPRVPLPIGRFFPSHWRGKCKCGWESKAVETRNRARSITVEHVVAGNDAYEACE